jgi:hypothetical protein
MEKNPLTGLNRKYARSLSVVILLTFPIITGSFSSSVFTNTEIYAKKYEMTQGTSETNVCGNDLAPFNILCENLDYEKQGNGNTLDAVGFQMSNSVTHPVTHSTAVECGPVLNLSENPEFTSLGPVQIAASNRGQVYTVWTSTTDPGADVPDTLFRKSNDGGVTFGEIENLSNNGFSGNITLGTPQVAASGNNVYVVWANGNPEATLVNTWLKRSTDGGNTFEPMVNLGVGLEPQVLALGNNVYVAWGWGSGAAEVPLGTAYLAFRVSTNGGANFEPAKNLWPGCPATGGACEGADNSMRLAAFGRNVAVVWQEFSNVPVTSILFTRSTDGGANFGPVKTLSETGSTEAKPLVAASGNNIFVIWLGQDGLIFTRSTDGGANFEPSKVLSEDPPFIFDFSWDMAVSGRTVNVVWSQSNDDGTRRDIFLARSTDSGTDFEPVKNLSSGNSDINNVASMVAAHRNIVYVVWSSSNNLEDEDISTSILLTRSVDSGANFGPLNNVSGEILPLQQELLLDPNLMRWPEIDISGRNAYVVWPGGGGTEANDVFFTRCM